MKPRHKSTDCSPQTNAPKRRNPRKVRLRLIKAATYFTIGLLAAICSGNASAAKPRDPAGLQTATDSLVQTAINGSYDSTRGILTLNRVEGSRTRAKAPAALVRTLAFATTFEDVFAAEEASPLATLVAHNSAGDGQRSHHLVRLRTPQVLQAANTVNYSVELLDPSNPPPATFDRAFLIFVAGDLTAVTDIEPLLPPDDLAASDLVEAFSTQTISGGSYEPATNLLRLRGVEHRFMASGRLLRAAEFDIADLAEDFEDAYRNSSMKPVASLAWRAKSKLQQAVIRLEDFSFDAATAEVSYAVTVLESSAPLPASFEAASLTIPPVISFGRGWPAHSVCCNCNAKCSVLWVLGYCKTCISPLGADKCCSTCGIPPSSGQSCSLCSDGQGLVTYDGKLILAYLTSKETRQLRVTGSTNGQSFSTPVTVPDQASNRGPGLAVFRDMVVMGYKSNDNSNSLWATLSTDGINFNGAFPVLGQQSPEPPALAVFQDRVWMAYRANNSSNQLYLTSSTDGKTWANAQEVVGQSSRSKPALATFQDRLVLAYRASNGSNQIYVTSTTDLKNWKIFKVANQKTNQAPALAVFKNRLFLAYKANDRSNRIFVTSSSDGATFEPPAIVDNQFTPEPPALTVLGDRIYLSYEANNDSKNIFVTSSANGKDFDSTVEISGE